MNRNILIVGALLVLVGIGAWLQWGNTSSYSFPLAAGDEVQSWEYQGAYTGNPELQQRADDEIQRLEGLLGKGEFTDYELYISIANQYELLGNGEGSYDTLRKALAIDSETTGLAWHNMGKLMERLGALGTARIAYDNTVNAQPVIQYQNVRIEFLKTNFPEDTEAIAAAEAQLQATLGEFILE